MRVFHGSHHDQSSAEQRSREGPVTPGEAGFITTKQRKRRTQGRPHRFSLKGDEVADHSAGVSAAREGSAHVGSSLQRGPSAPGEPVDTAPEADGATAQVQGLHEVFTVQRISQRLRDRLGPQPFAGSGAAPRSRRVWTPTCAFSPRRLFRFSSERAVGQRGDPISAEASSSGERSSNGLSARCDRQYSAVSRRPRADTVRRYGSTERHGRAGLGEILSCKGSARNE